MKKYTRHPKIGNRLIQLIRMDGSTRQIWVNAYRNFYDNFVQLLIKPVHEPLEIRGRPKNSKIRSFSSRTHLCLVIIMARATPGTDDLRTSDAALRS